MTDDALREAVRDAIKTADGGLIKEAIAKARTVARREALEEVIAMADKVAAGHRAMAQELMRRGEIPQGAPVADVPPKTIEAFRDAVRALLDKEPS